MNVDRLLERASWLAARESKRRPKQRWTAGETERLRSLIGRHRPSEIVKRMDRSRNSVMQKIGSLGYQYYTDVLFPLGLTARELARRSRVPASIVYDAIERGELVAAREGGKDFLIGWMEARRYTRRMERLQHERKRILDRIPERTISKQAFMRLLGLSETHAHRYLAGKIVKAWKVPCRWRETPRSRWEWRVSRKDARRVKRLREQGRLRLDTPAYRRMRERSNAQVRELRQTKRLGTRDDLRRTMSPVVPGHFTVAQIASHVGIAAAQVYNHIRLGRLKAKTVRVGTRNRMAVAPEALPAYLAWTRREQISPGPLRPNGRLIDQAHAAGYLTLPEAARRCNLPRRTLESAAGRGAVPHRKFGRLRAVRLADVRRYAKQVVRRNRWRTRLKED